jgi:hypothetical protein
MLRSVFFIVLLSSSLMATEDPNFKSSTKMFFALELDLHACSPPVKKVSNVPESIRYLPVHSSDGWGIAGVIPEDSAKAPWLLELRFLRSGLRSRLTKDILWENFADLSFNFGYFANLGGEINEYNYFSGGDNRGYGAALTFWYPTYSLLIPGLKSQLSFKSKEDSSWLIGLGYRQYDLAIRTGYDRYDSLETRDLFRLGKISETSLYTGWLFEDSPDDKFSMSVDFGVNFNDYDSRNKYKDINVELNKVSYFIGYSLIFRF